MSAGKQEQVTSTSTSSSSVVPVSSLSSPVSVSVRDESARRRILPFSFYAAAAGGVGGCVFSIMSSYPLYRSVAVMSLNAGCVSLLYLSTSVVLSERIGLHSNTLYNHMMSGGITFGLLYGLTAASRGFIASRQQAITMGVKGAMMGALVGAGVFSIQQIIAWRQEKKRKTATAVNTANTAPPSSNWVAGWLPVHVSTPAEIEKYNQVHQQATTSGESDCADIAESHSGRDSWSKS